MNECRVSARLLQPLKRTMQGGNYSTESGFNVADIGARSFTISIGGDELGPENLL